MTMGHATTIKNPGTFEVSGTIKNLLIACVAVGVATFAFSLNADPTRAWASFVMNHFYFMSLAIGGLFFATLQWITGAMWSAPIRRVSESLTAYLPVVFVTFAILYFGVPKLYLWSHMEHVKGDLVLEGKSRTAAFISSMDGLRCLRGASGCAGPRRQRAASGRAEAQAAR